MPPRSSRCDEKRYGEPTWGRQRSCGRSGAESGSLVGFSGTRTRRLRERYVRRAWESIVGTSCQRRLERVPTDAASRDASPTNAAGRPPRAVSFGRDPRHLGLIESSQSSTCGQDPHAAPRALSPAAPWPRTTHGGSPFARPSCFSPDACEAPFRRARAGARLRGSVQPNGADGDDFERGAGLAEVQNRHWAMYRE
jgi:hypothetical protein